MPQVASRLSHVTLDAERSISSGSIRVLNILVSNPTALDHLVTFNNNSGTTILQIAVPARDSETYAVAFIADAGLVVESVSDVNVTVTVAHGADGA